MSEPEDEALLTAWRAGDRQAGSVLFGRHFAAIHRFFATKVGDAEASDLAQRTFLGAVEARDRMQPNSQARAYLFGIARRQLWMRLRAQGRHGTPASLSESCAEDVLPSPSAVVARTQEETLVVRALRRIPLDLQMLLELHYWESLSTEQLGEIFEVPRGTIKSRLFRARNEARAALARLVDDPERRESSVQDFERWVRRLHDARSPDGSPSDPPDDR
jgi:RNA polymerase sigma factor (sigma-70 family)